MQLCRQPEPTLLPRTNGLGDGVGVADDIGVGVGAGVGVDVGVGEGVGLLVAVGVGDGAAF